MNELILDIAASIFISPCTEDEFMKRDIVKNKAKYAVQRLIMILEKDAIYYKGEKMFVYKEWAKKKLKDYDLDFRSKKEKELDGLSQFARNVYGLYT